jgi:hypothetical protein
MEGDVSDWIEWKGGDRPVSTDTLVEVRLRDSELKAETGEAVEFDWRHEIMDDDIIAYRIVKEPTA